MEQNQNEEVDTLQSSEDLIAEASSVTQKYIAGGMPSLNAFYLKKNYPATYKEVKDFIGGQINTEIDDEAFVMLLIYNAYTILTYFDQIKLFVNVTGKDNEWYYSLSDQTIPYTSRAEALSYGLTKAFEEREIQINNIKTN